jgi:hypothetical protein
VSGCRPARFGSAIGRLTCWFTQHGPIHSLSRSPRFTPLPLLGPFGVEVDVAMLILELGAVEKRLLPRMPLHVTTSVHGEAGLRERLLLEIAQFPPRILPGPGRRQRSHALHARDRRQREPYASTCSGWRSGSSAATASPTRTTAYRRTVRCSSPQFTA